MRVIADKRTLLMKIESNLSALFAEMREDLTEHPFHREFILIGRRQSYSSGGQVTLSYYFEEHRDLRQKVRILENHGLVQNITHTSVEKFSMSEELVDYLKAPN